MNRNTCVGLMHCKVYHSLGSSEVNNPVSKTKPVVSLWCYPRMSHQILQALRGLYGNITGMSLVACIVPCVSDKTQVFLNQNEAYNSRKHLNRVIICYNQIKRSDGFSLMAWYFNFHGSPEESTCTGWQSFNMKVHVLTQYLSAGTNIPFESLTSVGSCSFHVSSLSWILLSSQSCHTSFGMCAVTLVMYC